MTIVKTLIIGSGLGGLLCGYLLSREGMEITILEKHHTPGGSLQSFLRNGFSFDTGMHYLPAMASGQPLYRYWKYFGLTNRLELMPMDENGFDRISFDSADHQEGFMEFPVAQGFDNFRERLLSFFPDAEVALQRFVAELEKIAQAHPLYNLELPPAGYTDPFQRIPASEWLHSLSGSNLHKSEVKNIIPGYTKKAQQSNKGIILQDILCGNGFLYAWNPLTTPLSQFGLINHAFISSAWRIAGGSRQIADVMLEGIRRNGGTVLNGKQVTAIRRHRNQFVVETLDGDHFESMMVISGIHPSLTIRMLEETSLPPAYKNRLAGLRNTISVFTVYLGLKPGAFPFLNYNIYHHTGPGISYGLTSITSAPERELSGRRWPLQYLFMTPPEMNQGAFARTAVIMAPMNFEELRPWEHTRTGQRDTAYAEFKTRCSRELLEAVLRKFPALKDAIAIMESSSPLTWRDFTGTPDGSMYGIVKEWEYPERSLIHPRTKIPGLYLTGQNINLHGALGVTVSAIMTCGELLGLPYVLDKIKTGS